MTENLSDQSKTIDQAITDCQTYIAHSHNESVKWLWMFLAMVALISAVFFVYYRDHDEARPTTENKITAAKTDTKPASAPPNAGPPSVDPTEKKQETRQNPVVLYLPVVVFLVVLGICASMHKMHVHEVDRYQHFVLGLRRIRIAANNDPHGEGFSSEVRRALTEGAFDLPGGAAKGKIESPVPGHPGSDLATLLINKVMENFEMKPKQKDGTP